MLRGNESEDLGAVSAERIAQLSGIAICAIGSFVVLGWLLQSSLLVRLSPIFPPMGFPSALGFMLLGVALTAKADVSRRWPVILAGLAAAVGLLVLSQYLFSVDLMLDRMFDTGWLEERRPPYGRVAPVAAFVFVLAGISTMLIHLNAIPRLSLLAPIAAIAIEFIGVIGISAYFLNLELFLYWKPYSHLSMQSAIATVILGPGLWARWRASRRYGPLFRGREDRRTLFTAILALSSATVIGGLVGFSMLERQTEQSFTRSLELALQNSIEVYEETLKQAISETVSMTTRTTLRRDLATLRDNPGHKNALAALQNSAQNYLETGMTAVLMEDARGKVIVSVGHVADNALLRIPLGLTRGTELIWTNGMSMRMRRLISDARGPIGAVVTEQPLPLLTRLLENVRELGETAELSVCAEESGVIRCFPTRLRSQVFSLPHRLGQRTLPIADALQGFTGMAVVTMNANGTRAVAAYGPVPLAGLGMVVSLDAEEMYRPMISQFHQVLWSLALLVAIAVAVLWAQMKPLVNVLSQARDETNAAQMQRSANHAMFSALMERTNDAVHLKDRDGRYLAVNAAGARRLGRTASEIIGRTDKELWSDEMARVLIDADHQVISTGEAAMTEVSMPHYGGTRSFRVTTAPYRDMGGAIIGVIGIAHDITDRRHAEEIVRALSVTDETTGLHARSSFGTLADAELGMARRTARTLYLFYMRLQNIEQIVEQYGLPQHGQALQDVAEILRQTFRESDLIAYIGDADFAVLADVGTTDLQEQLMQRLRRHLDAHHRSARRPYELSLETSTVRYDATAHANLEALMLDAGNAIAHPPIRRHNIL